MSSLERYFQPNFAFAIILALAAFQYAILAIYMVLASQFESFLLPLSVMLALPFSMVGALGGLWGMSLLGVPGMTLNLFSLIGMILLAGLVTKNSILLVDFIMQEQRAGKALEAAVIRASAVRAKPIVLTAIAAMMGAFFILDDPIFNGLAMSLIFGILISTLLTLVVIPMLYYSFRNVLHPAGTADA